MNIVVTSPKSMDLLHKAQSPTDAFWSLKRKPKYLRNGEIVWVVKNGRVVVGFYVRWIVYGKHPVKHAGGYNPPESWRIWFSATVPDEELIEHGVTDEEGNPKIHVKGFQGFRYQWWEDEREFDWQCQACGEHGSVLGKLWNYCPYCGAAIETSELEVS